MRYTVENSAVEMAAKAMNRAMEEYKNANGADERRAAFARYREASAAYRTMLKARYTI